MKILRLFVLEYKRQFTQKGTVTVCFLLVSVGCSVIYPIARSTKRHIKENYKRLHLRVSESCFVIYPIPPQHKALNDFELELLELINPYDTKTNAAG